MKWRVFFVGPMKPPMTRHLPRLRHLLLNYLIRKRGYTLVEGSHRTVARGDDQITAILPQDDELAGAAIPQSVFHQIDSADLVVADLSGGRPAVAYELAMAHALGVYTALVGDAPDADLMFYLKQYRVLKIDLGDKRLDSPGALPPAPLRGAIDRWLEARMNITGYVNPFTEFYGAPLYDISAASGLAAGFYLNFARPILLGGKMTLPPGASRSSRQPKSAQGREMRGLIVLRPARLTDPIPQIENDLERTLVAAFGTRRTISGRSNGLVVQTEKGSRTAFYSVDDYLIDIPRTMFSLAQCYRMQRLQRLQQHTTSVDTRARDSLSVNMQEVLIDRFFEDLRLRVESDYEAPIQKFHVGTLEEIPLIIQTGQSRTFVDEAPTAWKKRHPETR